MCDKYAKNIVGGEVKQYTELLNDARKEAMSRMEKNAMNMNAESKSEILLTQAEIYKDEGNMKAAMENSDAVVVGSEELPAEFEEYLNTLDKPVLKFHNKEEFSEAYLDFYRTKVLS